MDDIRTYVIVCSGVLGVRGLTPGRGWPGRQLSRVP